MWVWLSHKCESGGKCARGEQRVRAVVSSLRYTLGASMEPEPAAGAGEEEEEAAAVALPTLPTLRIPNSNIPPPPLPPCARADELAADAAVDAADPRVDPAGTSGGGAPATVGRCRLTVSKPLLKCPMVSALEATT